VGVELGDDEFVFVVAVVVPGIGGIFGAKDEGVFVVLRAAVRVGRKEIV
jgi:hypothetical protein